MIIERIRRDFKEARINRDLLKSNLLSTLIGELENKAVFVTAGVKNISDEATIRVLKSFLKNIEEVSLIAKGREKDVALQELAILLLYLPQQLGEEDFVRLYEENGPFAKISDWMGYLKKNHAGLYDGKAASAFFNTRL